MAQRIRKYIPHPQYELGHQSDVQRLCPTKLGLVIQGWRKRASLFVNVRQGSGVVRKHPYRTTEVELTQTNGPELLEVD